ncbi:MAG: arginine deiminase family protein [Methanomicrobiaceae archaeon]|nr:arginine deiminase family protein [Methanomicrobiaceae archaeon]
MWYGAGDETVTTGMIRAEWDPLKTVVVHRPGIEMFFGLLEPYASLYERAFSRYGARMEHERMEQVLKREFGVDVIRLKEAILEAADRDSRVRERLVAAARATLAIEGEKSETAKAMAAIEEHALSLDSHHFFTMLLMSPRIELESGVGTRKIDLNITGRQPLSNLYFVRDQQAVADRGLVISRMAKPQRRREPEITKFLWDILGVPVIHEVRPPGTFEGGDFMPMKDFALVGIGDRTNRSGVRQLLRSALGFDEVGVVHQPAHPLIPSHAPDPMINMHLDTYFNVASSGVVLASRLLIEQAAVEVYHRTGQGKYERAAATTDLFTYIREKGFEVIDLTTLEQLSYASNVLCIGDGVILAAEGERIMRNVLKNLESQAQRDMDRYGGLLEQAKKDYRYLRNEGQFFPHKKEIYQHDIEAYALKIENLTGGYGGAHCMTCALERG